MFFDDRIQEGKWKLDSYLLYYCSEIGIPFRIGNKIGTVFFLASTSFSVVQCFVFLPLAKKFFLGPKKFFGDFLTHFVCGAIFFWRIVQQPSRGKKWPKLGPKNSVCGSCSFQFSSLFFLTVLFCRLYKFFWRFLIFFVESFSASSKHPRIFMSNRQTVQHFFVDFIFFCHFDKKISLFSSVGSFS